MDANIIPFPQIFKISDYRKKENTVEEEESDTIPFRRIDNNEQLRTDDSLSAERRPPP